jgi:hypothetical protein
LRGMHRKRFNMRSSLKRTAAVTCSCMYGRDYDKRRCVLSFLRGSPGQLAVLRLLKIQGLLTTRATEASPKLKMYDPKRGFPARRQSKQHFDKMSIYILTTILRSFPSLPYWLRELNLCPPSTPCMRPLQRRCLVSLNVANLLSLTSRSL